MRIDHHAYQRATKVAGLGLFLQMAIGLTLLVFGLLSKDTSFWFASVYVLIGIPVWLGLIIIFHQHKLERLEAIEEDELSASQGRMGSVFDKAGTEVRVAARRLALMHKWLMPSLSLAVALLLGGLAGWLLRLIQQISDGETEFRRTEERGWAIAICLIVAALSFVFSRFVAGMAKQDAWQNLRGGAAYMVGNALILVAIAVGIIFRFFENEHVIWGVAIAIPIFMLILAVEILWNFVLNLYRPRILGEIPRPAFDSKLLSLFATPDNIIRSLNEAVNYQFGFDVTSSWGYQLLLRSFFALLGFGVVTLVLLSTMVIVEPHQQAIRFRSGRIIDDKIYSSGVMWKWPWPFETAAVYDVARVRSLHLTARVLDEQLRDPAALLWDKDERPPTDVEIEPILVGSEKVSLEPLVDEHHPIGEPDRDQVDEVRLEQGERDPRQLELAQAVSDFYALVDAEIVLQYRIRAEEKGLLEFLHFASERVARRQTLTDRERAIRFLALAQVSSHLSRLSLDEVLSLGRRNLTAELRRRIQAACDVHRTGIEVVAVDLPMLRPSGGAAPRFEDLAVEFQNRLQAVALAESHVASTLTLLLGDERLLEPVLSDIDTYEHLINVHGADSPEATELRQKIERLLIQGGGQAAQIIADAETDRWIHLLDRQAQASRVRSQLDAYRAAPELFRQREQMQVYKRLMPVINKYVIAVDPSQVDVVVELKGINPLLDFAGASEEEVSSE